VNPIWLETIAHDDTLEKIAFIVTSFYLTTEGGWTVVVGDETYRFGEDEAAARKLYDALTSLKVRGGEIQFFEEEKRTEIVVRYE